MQSNKSIAIIGFGALGVQIQQILESSTEDKIVHVFDDISAKACDSRASKFETYVNHYQQYDFIVGIGYKHLQLKSTIINDLVHNDALYQNIIGENCFISKTAQIEKGVVIYPGSNIDMSVLIKKGTLINNSCIISHDSIIGESCYLSPGVILAGQVSIGDNSFIGSGAIISNGVTIGSNCIIGIGSVVSQDIPNNSSAIGNPLKILSNKLILT